MFMRQMIGQIHEKFENCKRKHDLLDKQYKIVRAAQVAMRVKRKLRMKADFNQRILNTAKRSINFAVT